MADFYAARSATITPLPWSTFAPPFPASAVYAKKVEALAAALNVPEARAGAAEALRMLIEKIVLTPGPERGELHAALYGDLGTILNWVERQAAAGATKGNTPGAERTGVSVSVVAGAGFEPAAFRL